MDDAQPPQQETSTLQWIWGLVQGDFNENPTVGQIICNAIITAIPLVDQVADARDLTANIKALAWDKRYNEFMVWLAFFFTLIGLIPSVGSLLKGVLKLVWRGAKLDEVLRYFNALAKGNGVRWLKELRAGKLRDYSQQAAQIAKQVIDTCLDVLNQAKNYVPEWLQHMQSNFNELIDTLKVVRGKVDEMLAKITSELEIKLDELLENPKLNSAEGPSQTTLMVKQEADPSVKPPNHLPKLPQSMDEVLLRMDAATEKVQAARASGTPLPQSPYTLDDKLRIVEAGLEEKYIVRIIETRYGSDDGSIGWVSPEGRSNYWTTTYTQLEYADKDAELISKAVGRNYDPNADYTLLVIDADAAAQKGDITTFIPTYDRLGELVKEDMPNIDSKSVDTVMTPEYSEKYQSLVSESKQYGLKLENDDDLQEFLKISELPSHDAGLLELRQKINNSYGANDQYLGTGLTKNVNSPDGMGAVETYSLDKRPGELLELEKAGVIKRIQLNSY